MTQSVLFAFTSVLFAAMMGTVQRYVMRNNSDEIAVMLFKQFAACMILLLFLGLHERSSITPETVFFFSLGGIFWAVKSWADLKASEHLDLNTAVIIGKLRFITLTLTGIIIFNEKLTYSGFLGGALILAAVFSMPSRILKKGLPYKVLSVLAFTIAVTNEKALTSIADIVSISIVGMLLPGLLVLVLYPRKIMLIPHELAKSRGLLMLLPIGLAGASYFLIKSLQLGELSVSIAIYQLDILLVSLLGFIFLREHTNLMRKAFSSALCVAGVLIVSFS